MHVDSLEVGNFRNYEFAKIDFHPNTNILYGDNAQGKTNLLEAVFVCGTTKSHRRSTYQIASDQKRNDTSD